MSCEANIYLIGARACGKTTLGRKLAARLKRLFVDTDSRIRVKTGKTVAEIVEEGGWEAFREVESLVLAEVSVFTGQVVSCGGGMVLRQDNREILARGITIYIDAAPEELAARLARDPAEAQRPSLTGAGLVEEVRQVLAEREPVYRSLARVVLDGGVCAEKLAEQALAEIARFEERRRR
jgi:shikimate kinase